MKSLLNMVVKKKRDTYLSGAAPGVNPDPSSVVNRGQSITLNQATTNGSQRVHFTLYNATHRFLVPDNYSYRASRTATRTYAVGLKEAYRLIPNTNEVWWHRRVVFSYKSALGPVVIQQDLGVQSSAAATTVRPFRDLSGEVATNGPYATLAQQAYDYMFKGTSGVDWGDPMRAPIDRSRINLHSDTFRKLSSGNEVSNPRITRHYTRINRSVVYDDEENGVDVNPSPFSVDSKPGIGNIFVADFFHCPAPGDADSSLEVSSSSTYYWHEK